VERNALRANLCTHAADWRWSSFALRSKAAMSDEEAAVKAGLTVWPVDRPGDWSRRVHQPESEQELAALRRSANKGAPLGTDRWVARTVARLGLESTVRPRGRPGKQEQDGNKSS